ncbi:hypothetical protein B0H14DRAFT_2583658 [Mycena olivaceomarginata]|nr:hypothetical protein B0H14DRAFT_2583658 [Mycena olivaceomarginata]
MHLLQYRNERQRDYEVTKGPIVKEAAGGRVTQFHNFQNQPPDGAIIDDLNEVGVVKPVPERNHWKIDKIVQLGRRVIKGKDFLDFRAGDWSKRITVDGSPGGERAAREKYRRSASALSTSSCSHSSLRRQDSFQSGNSVTQKPKIGEWMGRLKNASNIDEESRETEMNLKSLSEKIQAAQEGRKQLGSTEPTVISAIQEAGVEANTGNRS